VRFAINAPNFGAFAETRLLASLAQEAESAGWDGLFLWDHIRPGPVPLSDPWIQLAAMALNTSQIKLGTMVTPLPRRKPEELARQTVTLDRLSGGRLIVGVGLGDDMWNEYSAFGGAMVPESAARCLTRAWRSSPLSGVARLSRIKVSTTA
jgi:alkanesulfonate monooxygenase SsuD/methylene tetrahydromethanopterin reductase-like flavin-dependent oxidoreductase (luciferase family)